MRINQKMIMKNMLPVVTIDGPSGSGKGTLSKKLAKILGWNILDSGIIYRVLAFMVLNNNIDINNVSKIVTLVDSIKINFKNKMNQFFILCNEKNIKNNIYTETIGNIASKIAIFPEVRETLLEYQRNFCFAPGLIADGRDMGTVVFPNAILKIFLYASVQERTQRRLHQLRKRNFNVTLKSSLFKEIRERDIRDYNRQCAPLVPSFDSLFLDSTHLSEQAVQSKALMSIKENLVLLKEVMYNDHS